MPVGFQIFGDHGVLQIDQNYANLALATKGTLRPGNPNADGGNVMTVATSAANAIIFLRSGGLVTLGAISDSNGTRTFSVVLASGVAACDYWIFGKPPPPSSKVGLQIFDATGNVTFDAAQKYMRVIGAIDTSGTPFGGGNIGASFALPAVGAGGYAVALADPGYTVEHLNGKGMPTQHRIIYTWGASINGAALVVNYFKSMAAVTYPPNYPVTSATYAWRPPAAAIVLDVTGL